MIFFYIMVIHDMNDYGYSDSKQKIPIWKDFFILCVNTAVSFLLSVLTHKKLKKFKWKSFSYVKNKRARDRAHKRVNKYKKQLRNKK